MNLGQMRLEVRRAVAELTADLWSDAEINDYLNEGAKLMVARAQSVQAVYQFDTEANIQEYRLPDDIDEVFNIIHHDGSNANPLRKMEPRMVQQGGVSSGDPQFFWIKDSTKFAQHTSSGITVADPDPNNPGVRKVIGLFPVPSGAEQITVFYYSRHFEMRTDAAIPAIPPEYRRGIIAYATALCKEKEMAYAEADRKRQEFKDFADNLAAKMISEFQEIEFPVVKTDDYDIPFGDVVYKFGRAT